MSSWIRQSLNAHDNIMPFPQVYCHRQNLNFFFFFYSHFFVFSVQLIIKNYRFIFFVVFCKLFLESRISKSLLLLIFTFFGINSYMKDKLFFLLFEKFNFTESSELKELKSLFFYFLEDVFLKRMSSIIFLLKN